MARIKKLPAKIILHRVKASKDKDKVSAISVISVIRAWEKNKKADLDHKVAGIRTRLVAHNKANRDSKVSAADNKASRVNKASKVNRAEWEVSEAALAEAVQVVPAWVQDKEKTINNMPIVLPNKSLRP